MAYEIDEHSSHYILSKPLSELKDQASRLVTKKDGAQTGCKRGNLNSMATYFFDSIGQFIQL